MPATDNNNELARDMTTPLEDGFAITPHVSDELAQVTRAIWVGGAGNLVVVLKSGAELTISGILAGTLLPIRAKAVRATSTATNLVGLA